MTNKQKAVIETVKFILTVTIIGATMGLAIASPWGPWVGITACVALLIYGSIMIYQIKLSQLEAQERFKEELKKI